MLVMSLGTLVGSEMWQEQVERFLPPRSFMCENKFLLHSQNLSFVALSERIQKQL